MAYVRAERRQEEIVAAAVRVLSDVGVPGTTLRAVAAEAASVQLPVLPTPTSPPHTLAQRR